MIECTGLPNFVAQVIGPAIAIVVTVVFGILGSVVATKLITKAL